MRSSYDVLIIGGGVAGVSAALHARSDGAAVGLVRAGPGSSAVTAGGWTGPLDPLLAAALARAGLPFIRAPHPLPHPLGYLQQFDFAAASHAAPHRIDDALLCGIAGLGAFATPTLARLYATSPDRSIPYIVVSSPATPAAGWSPMSLAAQLEREPRMFVDAIAPAIAKGTTHVVMPAVLGIDRVESVRSSISEALGVPVFESLGAPPSLPGLRLDRAMMRALKTAGVDVLTGIVHGCDAEQTRISRVHVSADGVARTIMADRYVLASGKFLGGGVATLSLSAREQALVETALGLPVWIDHLHQSFSTAESLTLTSRVRSYDQPLLRAGVHIDATMQPLDARGRVIYTNLSVAGTVRADMDAGAGLGHASAATNGARSRERAHE
jgi:glycerol-3-phosphate dehydrogenase subunit B